MVNLAKKVQSKMVGCLLITMLVISLSVCSVDVFAEEVVSEATVKVINPTQESSESTGQIKGENSHNKKTESKKLPKTNDRFFSGNSGILIISMVMLILYDRKIKYKKVARYKGDIK